MSRRTNKKKTIDGNWGKSICKCSHWHTRGSRILARVIHFALIVYARRSGSMRKCSKSGWRGKLCEIQKLELPAPMPQLEACLRIIADSFDPAQPEGQIEQPETGRSACEVREGPTLKCTETAQDFHPGLRKWSVIPTQGRYRRHKYNIRWIFAWRGSKDAAWLFAVRLPMGSTTTKSSRSSSWKMNHVLSK